MENFGPYFWQFRREWLGGLTIFSWVLGSPVSLTTEGLDVYHDSESEQLVIVYLIETFFCIMILSNIMLAIMMEAYSASRGEGAPYKWSKTKGYSFYLNMKTLGSCGWFRRLFANAHFPCDWCMTEAERAKAKKLQHWNTLLSKLTKIQLTKLQKPVQDPVEVRRQQTADEIRHDLNDTTRQNNIVLHGDMQS